MRFAAYACESDAVIPGKKRERLTARLIKALMYKPDMEEAEKQIHDLLEALETEFI